MKQNSDIIAKQMNRHLMWTRFLRMLLTRATARSFGLKYEESALPEGANLILANHVTRVDFILISSMYNQHIYYVVGENILRNRLVRWLLETLFGVIGHVRGATSLNTIRQMSKRLSAGGNVCIFPEGSMTFDGRTRNMGMSIAKLARKSKANLVLCTIEGGYLSQPRWGLTKRRGESQIREYVVKHDELNRMSAEEIDDLINMKLFTDDYANQEKKHIRYRGRRLCKGLECCIYECPECRKISGLRTTGTRLYCGCGFEARYDEYGYLTDNNGNQYTVAQLCDNQKDSLRSIIQRASESGERVLLFEDTFKGKIIALNRRVRGIGKVTVKVYSDGVECYSNRKIRRFGFDDIEGVFVVLRNILNCIIIGDEGEYELKGGFSTNALKYRDVYEIIKENRD